MAALYDRIGAGYDATRRADPGIVSLLAERLRLEEDGRYLDLACGTGSYTVALAERAGTWSGVDASKRMLRAARARSQRIDWRLASAEQLPFADGAFDAAVCTLAVHHFPDRPSAFREIRRVVGGRRFVLFACDGEKTRRFWLREYFPRMFERIEAKEPTEAQMVEELAAGGFQDVEAEPWFVPDDLTDHMLYCGKRHPQLYFDARIRAGISSFADLADPAEVETGLARLRSDIDTGRIADVMASHPTPDGDYVLLYASGG